MTKTICSIALLLLITCNCFSQFLTTTPSGGNKKALVGEQIGLTEVTIHYDRPGVKGREGKIWGALVYKGFTNLGFGSSKAAPWRAGANENTTFTFSDDVKVEGHDLPAGTYGFFIAYDSNECTLIFSKNSSSWGSFYYNDKEDVLRVKVKPVPIDKSVEWLRYEFTNETDTSATVQLEWEKLAIPFTIQADLVKSQLNAFHNELRSNKGFTWTTWAQAAQWCVQHNVNLDEALMWADSASGPTFGGNTQFAAIATKGQVLEALGRNDESVTLMKTAMPLASMQELHQYGRQLIASKKPKEALDVFKYNAQKNPKQFTTLVGLARGYSANADFKNALKYAQQAQPIAPDPLNKSNVDTMIQKLKDGKDVN